MLLALKDLEAISIERKDGRTASETKSLIADLSKWSFLLSVFIWYDILFQVNKASEILQSLWSLPSYNGNGNPGN